MAHLNFKCYPGIGEQNRKQFGYSQTVKVGEFVYISGQGGWQQEAPYSFPSTHAGQIDQAWKNVQTALADGGADFSHVFKITSLHVLGDDDMDEVNKHMCEKLKELMPHGPLWTTIGVTKLGEVSMLVEIEVVAHVPKEGK